MKKLAALAFVALTAGAIFQSIDSRGSEESFSNNYESLTFTSKEAFGKWIIEQDLTKFPDGKILVKTVSPDEILVKYKVLGGKEGAAAKTGDPLP